MMRWHVVSKGRFVGLADDEAYEAFLDRLTQRLTSRVDDLTIGGSIVTRVLEVEFDVFAEDIDSAHRLAKEAFESAWMEAGAGEFDAHGESTERVLEPA